jgi:hypothetical protein
LYRKALTLELINRTRRISKRIGSSVEGIVSRFSRLKVQGFSVWGLTLLFEQDRIAQKYAGVFHND